MEIVAVLIGAVIASVVISFIIAKRMIDTASEKLDKELVDLINELKDSALLNEAKYWKNKGGNKDGR